VIVGDGNFGQMAFKYFMHDSPYQVVGFAVERDMRTRDSLFDLPVVNFEEIENHFSNKDHEIFVAITFVQLNRPRTRLYLASKNKGYKIASYVSPKASCLGAKLGENVFILEYTVIQPFAEIGNNVIFMGNANWIGHHTIIRDNCFISSHVAIAGCSEVGENCFIGINSSIADYTKIADDCFICMGSVVTKPTEPNNVYKGHPARSTGVKATEYLITRKN
jgi:sugar O-acyltransferase (sialic acid O-acetyltransferase NeuD family)